MEEKISELDKKWLGLIEEIRRVDPELGALTVVGPPKLEDIQSLLGPDLALIEYFHPGEHTVVLCSLWDVDDEATQALMTRFYKNYLNGMDKPTHLRKAQAYMMQCDKWSHTYYWRACVLFGDCV